MLGIRLVDTDVFNVPLLLTDPYGRFVRGPNGYPQVVMTGNVMVEGNPAAPISLANAVRTGHAFLDDIAHNAVPNGTPDADGVANPIDQPRPAGTYDDELLAAHFCTGDGRGNENIALTAVHTIFHTEHNRLEAYIRGKIETPGFLSANATEDAALRAAWQAQAPQPNATPKGSGWDYGERLFQAARFVTEMQYQHLVFEEFARTLVPSINPFVGDGINFHTEINPAIPAEFAHQAYRLGHSMLTETISRTRPDGSEYDISLLDGFLNPLEFNNDGLGGRLTAAQAAGAVFQGGTRQSGNEIDEFVTDAVRNNLLGLPLDLGVLNLARGRSEGVAPLNSVRRDLYAATGDPQLTPYESWGDFGFSIKHGESLVNFIAAYGVDPNGGPLNSATTLAAKRAAAQDLVLDPAFMFAPGAQTGVEKIDLWIGGLAEKIAPFGSMLGTTFNHIFENTLEGLQDSDRFYYLERLDGLNLLSQMEGNSFAELIARNTPAGSAFSASVFVRPDLVLNLDSILRVPGVISDDPTTPEVESEIPELVLLPNGTVRYSGGAHVIWNGRAVADAIVSSEGDDTIRGGDGNDRIEGGAGNDQPIGGAGNDIITDTFGDDVIKGGPGDDAIHGGSGPFDLLQGNEGNDFIVAGNDLSEVFGGPGNDIIYMGKGLSESIGGGGDDWMEGTDSPASIAIGDDNNQNQNDPNGGHDILLAGPGDMDFDSEGGDDILVGNVIPTHRFEGMLGFDWATYRGEIRAVDADMLVTGATAVNAPLNENRDRYDNLEGLSGTNFNDLLRGDNRLEADLRNDGLTGVVNGHVLNAAGIARITGLAALLPAGATDFAGGNIILGGTGSDLIEGRGGDDLIDGDRWLNVQLQGTLTDGTVKRANSLHELKADVFANPQRLSPTAITFIREIVTPVVPAADCGVASPVNCDVAVFSGARSEYVVSVVGTGVNRTITVDHQGGIDGRDTLRRVERLQFADQVVEVAGIGTVAVPNLSNLTEANARAAILAAGLQVGAVTTGLSPTATVNRVAQQDPLAAVRVDPGTLVSFVISLGTQVPDIHDTPLDEALAALQTAGLVRNPTDQLVSDPEIPAGGIAATNPPAGSIVPPGTTVTLLISTGPAVQGVVPNVVNLARGDAEGAIVAAGLTVGAVTFANSNTVASGSVISTNPVAGTVLAPGTAVAIRVSLGADGLVLAVGFDGDNGTQVFDSSAWAQRGAARQATMTRVPGKNGLAMQFDGVDDWVTFTDVAGSPVDLTNGMTLEAWVFPTGTASGWDTILMKERGALNISYSLYARDGAPLTGGFAGPASYIRAQNGDQPVRTNTALPPNAWSHVAATYDGVNQRLFVNGVLVATSPMVGNITVANGAVRIGGNASFAGEFFQGLIDDVRIYNRARNAAQITTDMNTPVAPPQ